MIDRPKERSESGRLRLPGQGEVLAMIAEGAPLGRILEELMLLLETQAPGMMCSVLLFDERGRRLCHGAAPSLPAAYNRIADGHEIGPAEGSCGTAAFRREQVIVTDIQQDPLWAAYRGIAERFGLRACWSTPILSRHRELLGTFAMYYGEPRSPTAEELALIELATSIASLAIERARTAGSLETGEERFALLSELRASEERFAIMFQSTPISLTVSSLDDGRLVAANDHFADITGYERSELIGRTTSELGVWASPELREQTLATLAERGRVDNVEAMCRTKSGELRPQLLSMRKITLDGRDCLLTAATDIADRKRADAERAALEQELHRAQRMEAIGRLAGGIAHDFNNLLTAIAGYAELLRAEVPAEYREDVDQIRNAAGQAAALTEQLLTFARRRPIQPEILAPNEIIRTTCRLLRRLIGTHIELVTVLADGVPAIRGDRSQIEQVISNLALNARDAMPDGGKLVIETSWSGRWVTVRVQDTGTGIEPEALGHVFEPFYTTKTLGRGTGLGLATVDAIVAQAGGTIAIESTPGRGTTVEVRLPAVPEAPTAPETKLQPPADLSLRGCETVLVVEDDEIVRALALRVLRDHGYAPIEARYASEALELWHAHRSQIQLVLTDVVMPGTSGPELARQIARESPELPIVLMSGLTDGSVAQGMNGLRLRFIEKPFSPQTLLEAVREALAAAPRAALNA